MYSISLPRARVVSTPSIGTVHSRPPAVNDIVAFAASWSKASVVVPNGGAWMMTAPARQAGVAHEFAGHLQEPDRLAVVAVEEPAVDGRDRAEPPRHAFDGFGLQHFVVRERARQADARRIELQERDGDRTGAVDERAVGGPIELDAGRDGFGRTENVVGLPIGRDSQAMEIARTATPRRNGDLERMVEAPCYTEPTVSRSASAGAAVVCRSTRASALQIQRVRDAHVRRSGRRRP